MPIIINPIINAVDPTLQEKTITENGEYTADEGYDGLSKVTVDVKGGASFNIHYGLNPPDDTSMLWVETEREPSNLTIGVEALSEGCVCEILASVTYYDYPFSGQVGSYVYFIGGSKTATYYKTIRRYDPELDTLTNVANLPITLRAGGCATVGTKIYMFGGMTTGNASVGDIYAYDTANNSVDKVGTLPVVNGSIVACAVGTKIYLLGGWENNVPIDTIRVFDTTDNTIDQLATVLPKACSNMGAVAIGTKIYLFGGGLNGSGVNGALTTINVFDTETQKIDSIGTLPFRAYGQCGVYVGEKIYLFGGSKLSGSSYVACNSIVCYDPISNEAITLTETLPFVTNCVRAEVIGTTVYMHGGSSFANIVSFDVSPSELAENTAYSQATLNKNVFEIASGDTTINIGVVSVFVGNSEGFAEKVKAYLHNGTAWTEI